MGSGPPGPMPLDAQRRYPRRALAGGLGAFMLARMKIELSVVVLSDGAASAPQALAVDVETPVATP